MAEVLNGDQVPQGVHCPNHGEPLYDVTWDLENGKAEGFCPISSCKFDMQADPMRTKKVSVKTASGEIEQREEYEVGILNPGADRG